MEPSPLNVQFSFRNRTKEIFNINNRTITAQVIRFKIGTKEFHDIPPEVQIDPGQEMGLQVLFKGTQVFNFIEDLTKMNKIPDTISMSNGKPENDPNFKAILFRIYPVIS